MKITAKKLVGNTIPSNIDLSGPCIITDPCYVFPSKKMKMEVEEGNDMWGIFCDALFSTNAGREEPIIFNVNGDEFIVQSTAWGDGGYPVYKNGVSVGYFGVDAGLFCIIPMSLIEKWGGEKEVTNLVAKELAVITSFENNQIEEVNPGFLKIGGITIDTAGGESEDNYDEMCGDAPW